MKRSIWLAYAWACLASGCAGTTTDEGDTTEADAAIADVFCAPGRQESCACPGSDRTGVQVCLNDGSRYGVCYGCPEPGPDAGGAGDAGGKSGTGGADPLSDAAVAVDPLACVETDLGDLASVARSVAAPVQHTFRWECPATGTYLLSGSDGDVWPRFDVRFGDCGSPVEQGLSGQQDLLLDLDRGTSLIIEVTWEAESRGTIAIAEYVPTDCADGEVDCGSGCVEVANTDESCGCAGVSCMSEEGKQTRCVAMDRAPYGSCEVQTPIACDEDLVLCAEECVAAPPAGYGLCDGTCTDISEIEHCGSSCTDCRDTHGEGAYCAPSGDDYQCRRTCTEPNTIDCGGAACQPMWNRNNSNCGCQAEYCPSWIGGLQCVLEDGAGVCRFAE